MMNTINNRPTTSNKDKSLETVYTIDPEDFYYVRQAYADCCVFHLLILTCMVFGVICVYSYDPNVIQNNEKPFPNPQNVTDFSNSFNISNTSLTDIENR